MVSDKILNSGVRNIFLIASILFAAGTGVCLARGIYWAASLLTISTVISALLLNRIYGATNESVSTFFDALRNDDTTIHFTSGISNRTLARLFESMNSLNRHFQEIKLKNEYNESYYKTLIQHASTGILVLDSSNRIELINKAASQYAGISPDSTNTNLLKIRHPAFYEAVCNLKPGESITYRNLNAGDLRLLLFQASQIRRNETDLKLVSIQDIRNELESKELESYRKLISVLTHEIMNLLSPLTTVSKELYSMFTGKSGFEGLREAEDFDFNTAVSGLRLINEQSDGLMNFVNNYRKISRIPQPQFTTFSAEEWMEQLRIAFGGKMKEYDIEFRVAADKTCGEIIGDKNLLNQVIINLLNNAFDAVMELDSGRKIEVHAFRSLQNRYLVRVMNSGPVIPPDLLEKIFVPFFTTKKNGSGIGLSISQEIMKRHNGSIAAISSGDAPTSFILEF